jgi:hypothetical protein
MIIRPKKKYLSLKIQEMDQKPRIVSRILGELMFRNFIFSILILLFSTLSIAKGTNVVDMSLFTTPAADKYNDLAYVQLFPQYEENPDPKKLVSIEVFSLELEKNEKTQHKLAYLKNIIDEDRRTAKKFKFDVFALTNETESFYNSKEFQDFQVKLGIEDQKVHLEEIPTFLDYTSNLNKAKKGLRYPSSLKSKFAYLNARAGIKTISLIRATVITGGVYITLHYGENVDPSLALSRAIWPGLVSGAMAYKSGAFGAFLTNGKWSTWLLESNNYFAKKSRSALGLNEKNFLESLRQNSEYYKEKYPNLYKNNPKLFDKSVEKISKTRVKDLIFNKLKFPEEYFKWWVTELAFVAGAFELPALATGAGIHSINSVLSTTTLGFLAQGPGDIALQLRKFQMIEDLQKEIMSGNKIFKDQHILLDQIDKTLKKGNPLTLHKTLHTELELLEAWARRRGALLSVLQVIGVGAGLAGIPIATPMLVGIGIWGSVYYASVQGLLKPKRLKENMRNFVTKVKNMKIPTPLKSIKARYCKIPFLPSRPNFIKNYAR